MQSFENYEHHFDVLLGLQDSQAPSSARWLFLWLAAHALLFIQKSDRSAEFCRFLANFSSIAPDIDAPPPSFTTPPAALTWLENHPETSLGTIVQISGVYFIVTAGDISRLTLTHVEALKNFKVERVLPILESAAKEPGVTPQTYDLVETCAKALLFIHTIWDAHGFQEYLYSIPVNLDEEQRQRLRDLGIDLS